jgi:2-oxo-hept-3-ene-1,7-dioate hydratase
MIESDQVKELAADLWQAEQTGEWTTSLSTRYPDADIHDAYAVGLAVRDLKVAAGRSVRGHKIGLTSKAMRDMTGATEPDYGLIYDDWFIPEGSIIDHSVMNRPMVEVELAFVMKSRLAGPSVNAADVIRATDFVLPALEIVDMRITKPGTNMLIDSISDGAWCGKIVLGGNPIKLNDIDPRRISASLSINGEIVESGSATAVMANPINAIAWLANTLHQFGMAMEPGDVVLSGSFIRAIPFGAGTTIAAQFDTLGEVTLATAPVEG